MSQTTRKKLVIGLVVTAVVGSGVVVAPIVQAQSLQQQINELSQQNAAKLETGAVLDSQAASLQDAIARLQAQISGLQTQIQVNEAKRIETVAQIAKAEADLIHQKSILSDDLKAMYIGDQMTSLEQLATSKDLSEFADAQQYKIAVQHKIQGMLKSINELKAKLATEKANLERMIAELNAMRNSLATQQAEQSRLLSLNQAQQSELDAQIKSNRGKITELRAQQALLNRSLGGGSRGIPGGGGYPGIWANAPIDSLLDDWGMYNRQCVSWTAWKVASSGRNMPKWGLIGRGNANQWDDNARRANIPVDSRPRVGDVAVSNAGEYGHVMYVEHVAGNGAIFVSDYNQQWDGLYREYWIDASRVAEKGLVFIHFP